LIQSVALSSSGPAGIEGQIDPLTIFNVLQHVVSLARVKSKPIYQPFTVFTHIVSPADA
jgi:hypothetical protein